MSKFLGPIHYIMFNKIKFQEEITENILNIKQDYNINDEVNSIGTLEVGELEDLIDTDNIHGWLQERVELVEKRFALAISLLLKEKEITKEDIVNRIYELGKNENLILELDEAFDMMNSKFLDGMPCDRAIALLERSYNSIKFIINEDFHLKYWINSGYDNLYWELRNEYIKGFLHKSNLSLYEIEENIYEIR